MLRHLSLLLLPTVLLLVGPGPADASWRPPWRGDGWRERVGIDLTGAYINRSNGGQCQVSRRGRGYDFVNENGTPAFFVYSGPRRLRMVSGDWDPDIVVTVTRGLRGRIVLRFDSPNAPTGYWVSAD
jgi:hypothetical protein